MPMFKNIETKVDLVKRTTEIAENLAQYKHVTVTGMIISGEDAQVKIRHDGFNPVMQVLYVYRVGGRRQGGYRLSFYDFIQKECESLVWGADVFPVEVVSEYVSRMDLFLEGKEWRM